MSASNDHPLDDPTQRPERRRELEAIDHDRAPFCRLEAVLVPKARERAPGLLVEILMGLEADPERSGFRSILERHRVVYVAAATAATAATAAGAIVIAARTRRPASA